MLRPLPIAARRYSLALIVGAIVLCAPASASAAERTGRLLVLVDESAQSRTTTAALRRVGARRAGEQVPQVGLVTVRPGGGRTIASTASALRKLPWVNSVTPERRYSLRFTPNDPALSEMQPGAPAGTPRQWWAARENLFTAWDITRGTGAKVAIIDSGIDGTHPEFAGKIALARDNDNRTTSGPAQVDELGHGTHVASLACARGDNGVAISGTGMNCELIVLKSDLSDASVAKSIVEATDLGADAINMSFGYEGNSSPPASLLAAIDYAVDHNVVLVAAAANDPVQNQGDPANLLQPTGTGPDITFNRGLTVTSANFNNQRSAGAGKGSQISIAAYGSYSASASPRGILGALPRNTTELDSECACRVIINGDRRYGYLSGTSMATPQVTGIAALVAHLNPDLTADAVVRLIKQTATRAGSAWEPNLGWGIVNGGAAVTTARLTDRRAPKSRARGPKRLRRTTKFTLKWTGKDAGPPGVIASGIRRYHVYRSKNGGEYRKIATTTKNSRRIRTVRGARYRFFTIATDRRGNREQKPDRADVSLRVSSSR